MVGRPLIAVVGAPNVGKSTLFNRLAGTRRALVHDLPGMTRDRISAEVSIAGRPVELMDTGGILSGGAEEMARLISSQAVAAMEGADAIILVVDGRAGLLPGDHALATAVRRLGRPVVVAVNKLDTAALAPGAAEFHALGLQPVLAVSAEHGLGIEELEAALAPLLPAAGGGRRAAVEDGDEVLLALVGRPNVGKSSLLNRLLKEDRVLVSPTPGTTRDAVDTLLRAHGRRFRLVDTAGLRRRRGAADAAESLAMMHARRAMARAQIAVLVMDATAGITAGDLAVAGEALEAGRAVLPVLNKWDLVEGREDEARRFRDEAATALKFLPHGRLLTVSAATGLRVRSILREALRSHADFTARRPTREWNRALKAALAGRRPPVAGGRPFRFYYAVQTGSAPPRVELFANRTRGLPTDYRRYLENRFRALLDLSRTPLQVVLRPRPRPRA